MLVQYAAVGLLFIGAVFFACAALIVSRLLQPHNPYKQKNITYECGMLPLGDAWVRFKPSYFVTGLIFLLFDVETMFDAPALYSHDFIRHIFQRGVVRYDDDGFFLLCGYVA